MSLILFEQQGPIGKIILNNPKELNAMTPPMAEALTPVIQEINKNPKLRVVCVTGSGRAFSAGGNLDFILEHTKKNREQNKREMVEFYSKFLTLRNIEVPTLAVINGPAMGAGFCLAMACDFRLASVEAKMGLNFSKIGLSSGMGTLYFLTRLAGPAVAADLLFTGRSLSAEEAQHLGLVNHLYPASQLQAKALEWAQAIAQNAPVALKIMKKGLQRAGHLSLEQVFEYESGGQAETFATQDLKEGVLALQEKRNPVFQGK